MKGYFLKRSKFLSPIYIYFGKFCVASLCYRTFVKYFPHLKLKPGEKIPVNIKITRRKKRND